MCSGRLFQATGPATQNARLPSSSLVPGTNKSPRAAERRAGRLGTVETEVHISFTLHGARPMIALYTCMHYSKSIRIFVLILGPSLRGLLSHNACSTRFNVRAAIRCGRIACCGRCRQASRSSLRSAGRPVYFITYL